MAMNTLVHFEKNDKKNSSRDKLLLHLKDYYPKPSVKNMVSSLHLSCQKLGY